MDAPSGDHAGSPADPGKLTKACGVGIAALRRAARQARANAMSKSAAAQIRSAAGNGLRRAGV